MAENLARRVAERPWLVTLQWAVAVVVAAISVWALGGP